MKKHWVQAAVGHNPGALHKALGIPEGQKIPLQTLEAAAKRPGKVGQEARLALTMRHFHHPKKGK